MLAGEQEVLVDASTIKENDKIVIHMGNVIPFDGTVESGEGMVNQASMTGESAAVRKYAGTTVYAGTVPVSYTHLDVYKRQRESMPSIIRIEVVFPAPFVPRSA